MSDPASHPVPRLYRRPDLGLLGGVAAGIATHLRVARAGVRIVFVLLAAAGGLGVVLYGAYLVVVPTDPAVDPARSRRRPAWLEFVMAAVAAIAAVAVIATELPRGTFFVPVVLAVLGGALIWRQASEPDRARLRRLPRASLAAGGGDALGRARLAAGFALVVAGVVVTLARADVTEARDGLVAGVVCVIGLVVLTGPWWLRLVTQLSDERAERIRTQERAEIAAQLHDSVLQTLALIQRNAGSPREVVRLARGQERELRGLLYEQTAAHGQFGQALRAAAGEVEDAYAVAVEVVLVGDAALDERLGATVAATREALVNAAKHAGVDTISLYAEVERVPDGTGSPGTVRVYVKDRGKGFAMHDVAEDRQGIRGSIRARVERHGGAARVASVPGEGTEVEITVPLPATGATRAAGWVAS